MEKTGITAHCIVRNEEKFIEYAVKSVLPYVDQFIIYDTGSTDKTAEIVKSINSPRIFFQEKGTVDPAGLTRLRNEQIKQTHTKYFILVDGDEVWPKLQLEKFVDGMKNSPKEKVAFFCRTRNAVGDIYHYLPEDAGKYNLGGMTGHLNMRGFRNVRGLEVRGNYPLEEFTYQGRSLNSWDEKLQFVDAWYFHATHLQRSAIKQKVMGFRARKIEKGIKFKQEELPEVFQDREFPHRSVGFEIRAGLLTPLKKIKRKI